MKKRSKYTRERSEEELSVGEGERRTTRASESDYVTSTSRVCRSSECESARGVRDNDYQEELDFQFDEDLEVPTGRHNTFTAW